MLTIRLEQLWTEYLAAEKDRIRDVMMPALERFIDELLALPSVEWKHWAKETASAISDQHAGVPVRFPLFRRVLLPALVEGVLNQESGCARWLAHFESLLVHSHASNLPAPLRTVRGLLREAVRVDPSDDVARRRLIVRLVGYLEYTLHELPIGVLYGTDGATEEQCEELLVFLDEFKAHVQLTGQSDTYAELIQECEGHYSTYRDYVRGGRPGGSYEAYMTGRGDS